MTHRLITADNLGAWLLKCNADFSDLGERAAGQPALRIDRWCVRPGYRSALMAKGQPVVFWVSGSRGTLVRGVWGIGRLASAARRDPVGPADAGIAAKAVPAGWHVELDLRLLPADRRVSRAALRADPRLADLEVLRQPQAANPSFVNPQQLAALADYLPELMAGASRA